MLRGIKDMTFGEFIDIADIACNMDLLNRDYIEDVKEIEEGGYGLRRTITWKYTLEYIIRYNSFTITSEYKTNGWSWSSNCLGRDYINNDGSIEEYRDKYLVNCCNPALVVDYCDSINLDVRNYLFRNILPT